MISIENYELFSKWVQCMPNKIISNFNSIYIGNINSQFEFNLFGKLFLNAKFKLNNLLFELPHISKSTYMFDLFILNDIDSNVTSEIITEIKENIINTKGEIWIFCDNKEINNNNNNHNKIEYINTILNTTSYRSSTIKFSDNFSIIIIK